MIRRVIILAVLVFAGALRLWGIGRQSLWFDEAATAHIVAQPIDRMMQLIISDERTPPLHYFLLHFWRMIFGDSEFSLRLPSALAGTAAAWVLFRIGEKLFGFWPGIIAALLLASSRYQILYSQEARAYSLMLFLGLLSCDFFLRLLLPLPLGEGGGEGEREQLLNHPHPNPLPEGEGTRARRRKLAYVLVTTLLIYSHLYGVFIILAQNITFLVAPKTMGWRKWITLQLAVIALFAPWIPIAIRWTKSVNQGFWTPPAHLLDIATTFRVYCGSTTLAVILVALAILSWHGFSTRASGAENPESPARVKNPCHKLGGIFSLSLMLAPVAIPVLISMLTTSSFTNRYGIIAPAGLFLLAGFGVMQIPWRALRAIVVLALLVLSLTGHAADWQKPDWRDAARYLESSMKPTDIAAVNSKWSRYLYDYYVHRPDVTRKAFDGEAVPLSLPLPQGQHVWLILHNSTAPKTDILARGGWRVVSEKSFRDVLILELDD